MTMTKHNGPQNHQINTKTELMEWLKKCGDVVVWTDFAGVWAGHKIYKGRFVDWAEKNLPENLAGHDAFRIEVDQINGWRCTYRVHIIRG